MAFAVADGGSKQIWTSQVLLGLNIALLEAVLRRSQIQEDGEINCWLLPVFNN